MTNTEALAPAPAAVELFTLRLVTTRAEVPGSTSFEVPVASRAEAHQRLEWSRPALAASVGVVSVTGYLTDPQGRYAGSGLACAERVVSDWA